MMKDDMVGFKKYLSGFIVIAILVSCTNSQPQSDDTDEISPEVVKEYLEQNREILVIDVRTPGEYNGELGHIPGSILHPVQKIEHWISQYDSLKNNAFVMVCRSGNRSGYATEYFKKHGYSKVYNMVGGMKKWNSLNYPVEKLENNDE